MSDIYITLDKEEYLFCEKESKNRWASSKKGQYGKGLVNTDDDPFFVERIGLLGENAVFKYLGIPFVTEYRKGGDGGWDINLNKTLLDIKCGTRLRSYHDVRYHFDYNCDGFIFTGVEYENQIEKTASILLYGYCSKIQFLASSRIGLSKLDKGKIRTLDFCFLKNIKQLKNISLEELNEKIF